MIKKALQVVEEKFVTRKSSIPDFSVGDTVDVHIKIKEGDRERTQVFSGVVIRRRGGGANETFTVRRIVDEEGVERTWPVLCPSIERIDVKKRGKVRRARLYYLRARRGKATKIKELRLSKEQLAKRESAKKAGSSEEDSED